MIRPEVDDVIHADEHLAMTPMIDVIFTLIAFMMLMINAPLLTMDISLPEAGKSNIVKSTTQQRTVISILPQDGQWIVDQGEVINRSELKEKLALLQNENSNFSVLLATDKTTYVQRMVDTISILNQLNIKNSQIAINKVSKDAS
jgi:biopolymer transport protein ExbD